MSNHNRPLVLHGLNPIGHPVQMTLDLPNQCIEMVNDVGLGVTILLSQENIDKLRAHLRGETGR